MNFGRIIGLLMFLLLCFVIVGAIDKKIGGNGEWNIIAPLAMFGFFAFGIPMISFLNYDFRKLMVFWGIMDEASSGDERK